MDFDTLLKQIIEDDLKLLITRVPKEPWSITPKARALLSAEMEAIENRYLDLCIDFAMHRLNCKTAEQFKRAKPVLTEEDLRLAWLAIHKI